MDRLIKCIELDVSMESRKWAKEIPFLSFPSHWLVKAVPPFLGAIVRYNISLKDYRKALTSIYLDCYDFLGFVGRPYWEIYPIDGWPARCPMEKTNELLYLIAISLEQQIIQIIRRKKRRRKRRHDRKRRR